MDWIHDPQAWVALATLTALEIVLGVDNIVFISILTGRLPPEQRGFARQVGLGLAMAMRVALLFMLSWIMKLTTPLFAIVGRDISGRSLILLVGGLFLLAKATLEIHHKLEGEEHHREGGKAAKLAGVLVQIMLLDAIFSLDSVITAVGMAQHLPVMIIAVVISVGVMVLFVNVICRFVEKHPTFKILALSFLLLIGVGLIAEALSFHIPKGYIYFAMAFSLGVEVLNLRIRHPKAPPVKLRGPEEEMTTP